MTNQAHPSCDREALQIAFPIGNKNMNIHSQQKVQENYIHIYDQKMRELLLLEPVLALHNFPQYGKESYR